MNIGDTNKVANRILELFNQPIKFNNHELYVTFSIGIAIYPHHGKNERTTLRNYTVIDCTQLFCYHGNMELLSIGLERMLKAAERGECKK
ncbi:hypothetical protein L1766_09170 [Thermovorax subterraneus]|nr:hypothetical protein [Thermovorax subterraneus]